MARWRRHYRAEDPCHAGTHTVRQWRQCLLFGLLILAALLPASPTAAAASAFTSLHVVGADLIAANNQPVRLIGVNRAGTEYACSQGWGIFDGPSDAASVAAMRAWGINTVRVPLNEHCWLGLDSVRPEYRGETYRTAIRQWVSTLREAGLYVILDLHLAAPAGFPADQLRPMPNRDFTPEFWRQIATLYRNDSAVIFDLYNEPYPDLNRDTEEAWRCWRDGGTCQGVGYPAAGMQELIDAVRDTGATNVILLSGIQYANTFSRFRAYAPHDPLNNYAVSWHSYNFMHWAKETSWDAQVGIPTAGIPLIADEIGQDDCQTDYLDRTLRWLDARNASYLAWAWNTWGRCDGPVLIDDYSGTPSTMGQGFYDHLARLGPQPLAPRPGEAASNEERRDPSAPLAPPESPGALVLYNDVSPAPFWIRPVGTNATNPCDTLVRSSGRCAYAAALSAWGALNIGADSGISTTNYQRLEWAFNSHWQSLANFSVTLVAHDGTPLPTIGLDQAIILDDLGDGWVHLGVSLASLNPNNLVIGSIVFRNTSGHDLSVIHLDDIQFIMGNLGSAITIGAEAIITEQPHAGH